MTERNVYIISSCHHINKETKRSIPTNAALYIQGMVPSKLRLYESLIRHLHTVNFYQDGIAKELECLNSMTDNLADLVRPRLVGQSRGKPKITETKLRSMMVYDYLKQNVDPLGIGMEFSGILHLFGYLKARLQN